MLKESKSTTPVTTPISANINESQKKIINLIRKNNKITKVEIANKLKMTKDGVKYNLKKLSDKGYVKYKGNSKKGY